MATLSVRVTTRSAKPGIGAWKKDPDGRAYLEVRVASAPSGGAANEEVVRLIAKALGIPKSTVRIASGALARLKRLDLPVDEADIHERLKAEHVA